MKSWRSTSSGSQVAYTERAAAWELRGAWATQVEVVVVLEADRGRVRGYVEHVAASNAYALIWDGIGNAHVPLSMVATVRYPHFHEPLDGERVARPEREPRIPAQIPGQLAFEGEGFGWSAVEDLEDAENPGSQVLNPGDMDLISDGRRSPAIRRGREVIPTANASGSLK